MIHLNRYINIFVLPQPVRDASLHRTNLVLELTRHARAGIEIELLLEIL